MQSALAELWYFFIANLRASHFGVFLLSIFLLTEVVNIPFVSRYDFIFIAAVGFQLCALVFRFEQPKEFFVIFLFHLLATGNSKKLKTIIERILFENNNLETNRLVLFSESKIAEYLANVQNVKRDHFDYLIYVLLFADCVKIFFAKKKDIRIQNFSNWSDKHGRYDALGK